MWSPFVNLTNPVLTTGRRTTAAVPATYDALLLANISGGWLASFDTGVQSLRLDFVGGIPDPNPLRAFVAPGLPGEVFLNQPNFLQPDTGADLRFFEPVRVNTRQSVGTVARQVLPFTFLADLPYPPGGPLFPPDDGIGIEGYPFPVSEVDAGGLWGLVYRLPTQRISDVNDQVAGRVTTIAVRAQSNPLTNAENDGPELFAAIPTFANTHKVFFPIDTGASLACEETASAITRGNTSCLDAVNRQLALSEKPAVTQVATGIGDPIGNVICIEQEVRITNPSNAQGNIRTSDEDASSGIRAIVPGTLNQPMGNEVRFIELLECNGVACENCPDGVSCPRRGEVRTVNCPDVNFSRLDPGGPSFNFRFLLEDRDGNDTLAPGRDAFVKYAVAAQVLEPSAPTFLTGRGIFGTRVRWQDETTPDGVRPGFAPPSPDPFDRRNDGPEVNFGPPVGGSGEEDGEGGTSTSTNGSSAPDPTLATIRSLRIVLDGSGEGELELTTGTEFNTAGFEVIERIDGKWHLLSPFLQARPDRIGSVYLAPVSGLGTNRQLMVREYELTGGVREHGPFDVSEETIELLSPAPGVSSYERPDVQWADAPTTLVGTRSPEPGERARATVASEGVYRVAYDALASSMRASAPELAAAAGMAALRVTLNGRALPYEPGTEAITFWVSTVGDETSDRGTLVFELGPGALVRSLSTGSDLGSPASEFIRTVRFEEDTLPAPGTGGQRSDDVWMWRFLLAGSATDGSSRFVFDAPHSTGGRASVNVELRGGSKTNLYPDHEVVFRVNGEEVHRRAFYGFDVRSERFDLPEGLLTEEGNTLEVEAVLRSGTP
ncbi:MAG: hypothetical protein AAF658_07695, partial [Myxococcota bacterium]